MRPRSPMVLGKVGSLVFVSALLSFPVAPTAQAVAPPIAVMALVASDASLVYWAPASPSTDDVYYKVYGIVGGSEVYLQDADVPVAVILATYEAFAVTTVVNGIESVKTYSVSGLCVRTGSPPDTTPTVSDDCSTGVYGGLILRQ